jgi:hypothetical protein
MCAKAKKAEKAVLTQPIPQELLWLADAPLFIDGQLLQEFYDAVAQPSFRVIRTLEASSKSGKMHLGATGKAGAELDLSKAFGGIGKFFAGVATGALEAQAAGTYDRESGKQKHTEAVPIESPQRQLLALTLHYVAHHPSRIFLIDDPADKTWRDPSRIAELPRALVFLEFGGAESNRANANAFGTLFVPAAAEFHTGGVAQIFSTFKDTADKSSPKYPERGDTDKLQQERRSYWQWFKENISPTQAMIAVEDAAKDGGRLEWIDYRVPITTEGDTLHLHVCPRGHFATGVLAYNFIKRGFKHGIRIVGTLKSEPDLNVLAIYER